MMANTKYPSTSVIIPVYNDSARLKLCLEALQQQTYPKDSYEVIVVDNNSMEDIKSLVAHFGFIYTFEELKSSYAARNKGLSLAKGEIIGFTDSDCIPDTNWISNGISQLVSNTADLVGGKVEFSFSDKETASEIYDSLSHMKTELTIKNGMCQTANLFVKLYAFKKIGLFPENIKSGGDSQWTKKATDNGLILKYEPNAIVRHPTRLLLALLKKYSRTAFGQIPYWISQDLSFPRIILNVLEHLLPKRISTIKRKIQESGTPDMEDKLLSIWFVAFSCTISASISRIISLTLYFKWIKDRETNTRQMANSTIVNESPKVSVIIPTYNRPKLLLRAINSVVTQTYTNLEIIVIDNASTDNIEEIVKNFNDNRIKYLRHDENRGGSAARNAGIKNATGEYISFLDDDDEILPEKIQRQIYKFKTSSAEVGIIYCGASYFCDGKEVKKHIPRHRGNLFREILKKCIMASPTPLIKKSILLKTNLYDVSLPSCQDWDLWIQISQLCEIDFIDDILAIYHIHGNQISTNIDNKIQALQLLIQKYMQHLNDNKNILAFHYRHLSYLFCLNGNISDSFKYAKKTLQLDPLKWQYYIGLLFFCLPLNIHIRIIKHIFVKNFGNVEIIN